MSVTLTSPLLTDQTTVFSSKQGTGVVWVRVLSEFSAELRSLDSRVLDDMECRITYRTLDKERGRQCY